MKPILTTAAAFALASAAAFAQENPSPPSPVAVEPPLADTQTDLVANLPGGEPPAVYPVCTDRQQDRCIAQPGSHARFARAAQVPQGETERDANTASPAQPAAVANPVAATTQDDAGQGLQAEDSGQIFIA